MSELDLFHYVPKYYLMDVKTEGLLPNSRSLREGMEVLIENAGEKVNLDSVVRGSANYDKLLYQANVFNRWCTVSDVELIDNYVYFTATYKDGVKVRRNVWVATSWLVKLDGIDADELFDFKPADVSHSETPDLVNPFEGLKQIFERYNEVGVRPSEKLDDDSITITARNRFQYPDSVVRLLPHEVNPHLHDPF